MSNQSGANRAIGLRVLITGASLIVVIAGLRAAGPIIVPVLLAAFLAVLALRPIEWLQARKVPDWAAVTLVLLGVIATFGIGILMLGNSIANFSARLPEYEAKLKSMTEGSLGWLDQHGLPIELSTDSLLEYVDASQLADLVGTLVTSLGSMLSDTAFVLMTTAFIMAEAAGLPRKLQAAFGPEAKVDRFSKVIHDIQAYLSIKTRISLISATLVTLLCWAVGVDYPLLWGVISFFLNFIPNIGSVIALIPPTLLAFVLLGWGHAIGLVGGYLAIEMVMGNIVEPRIMGRHLGLSSLVIFLALVFWGWIWGPVGMFLSVPLTMVVKILLESSDDMKWVAVLLGSGAEMKERAHELEVQAAASMSGPVVEPVAPAVTTPSEPVLASGAATRTVVEQSVEAEPSVEAEQRVEAEQGVEATEPLAPAIATDESTESPAPREGE